MDASGIASTLLYFNIKGLKRRNLDFFCANILAAKEQKIPVRPVSLTKLVKFMSICYIKYSGHRDQYRKELP